MVGGLSFSSILQFRALRDYLKIDLIDPRRFCLILMNDGTYFRLKLLHSIEYPGIPGIRYEYRIR